MQKARHIQPLNYWQTNLNSIYTWPGLGFPQTRCEETTLSCALIATKISSTCHLEKKKTWRERQQGVKKLRSSFLAAEYAPLHAELRWSQVSSDRLVEGGNTLSEEIVFTVCRKLITRNKLISRYSFRINCIYTEVTGSDGSSSW